MVVRVKWIKWLFRQKGPIGYLGKGDDVVARVKGPSGCLTKKHDVVVRVKGPCGCLTKRMMWLSG